MSLAGGPPDLPYPKLPFWDTVSLSYSTYFSHFIDALRASWLWLLVVAAFTYFASWQQWSWMASAVANLKPGLPPQMPMPTEMAVLLQFDNILLLFAGVSIAVAWHRLMILHERPAFSSSNIATKTLWRYVGMAIAIFLINVLPAAVIMFPAFYFLFPAKVVAGPPAPGMFALIPLILLFAAIGLAVAFRLSLLLPARAVDDMSITFKQAWLRTRGNTWRLFWGVTFTTLPPLLLIQIAMLATIGFPGPGFAGQDFVARMTVMSTVSVAYYLLITPIGIGFLSHAYRHFFQGGLDAIE